MAQAGAPGPRSTVTQPGRCGPRFPLRPLLVLGICLAHGARAAQAASGGDAIPDRAFRAVFAVESQTLRGSGFLVEPPGLILTSSLIVRREGYLAVTVAPGRKVPARLVASSPRYGLAVIQVNPEAVAGLEPLSPAGSGPDDRTPAERDRFLLVGAFADGSEPVATGVARKVRAGSILLDAVPPEETLGGPVLDLRGRVVGICGGPHPRRAGPTYVHRIRRAKAVLEKARIQAARTGPPPFKTLPVPGGLPYPEEALARAAPQTSDRKAYRTRAGRVGVDILTPPLIHSLARHRTSSASREGMSYDRQEGFLEHESLAGSSEPVVTVRAVPEIRRRAWTYVGVTAYWVTLPVMLVAALISGGRPDFLFPPPRVSSRFKPPLGEMKLFRGGEEVTPIFPGRRCGPMLVAMRSVDDPDGRHRRVHGCYNAYKYPPEAFEPGAPIELRLFREDAPADPEVIRLDGSQVNRIWSDFGPYFEALGKEKASDPPAPSGRPGAAPPAARGIHDVDPDIKSGRR